MLWSPLIADYWRTSPPSGFPPLPCSVVSVGFDYKHFPEALQHAEVLPRDKPFFSLNRKQQAL